ncbi:MAG: hypothetical protein GTO45_14765 [Candidatus Aminicenantes bacterium]|nr:hypothetical protein [Candidatus Aminicenantes bacterium]NIM80016.1 hypothetical protein [Candidatus Aminicenantes bacterium]NIN19370.1 hypothetical protein [Candidatus Aminicenantes bacterium]NIN43269.1 hypothetical protein [Candidatus Aminicenantes bacterium]NIN86011.1 hypothetical protein [Candidatus Aminicenantes bacterium]
MARIIDLDKVKAGTAREESEVKVPDEPITGGTDSACIIDFGECYGPDAPCIIDSGCYPVNADVPCAAMDFACS